MRRAYKKKNWYSIFFSYCSQVDVVLGVPIIKCQHHGGRLHAPCLEHLHRLGQAGNVVMSPEKFNLPHKFGSGQSKVMGPVGDQVVVKNDNGKGLPEAVIPISKKQERI